MGWMTGVLGFDTWLGLGIFLFTIMSRMALGPTLPPIRWVPPGALSLGVKQLGCEAITHLHLVLRSKNEYSCTSTPTICLHGVVLNLKKAQGQLLPLFVCILLQDEIFTTLKILAVVWIKTMCSDVVGYEYFWRPCCLHLQGEMLVSYHITTQCYNPKDDLKIHTHIHYLFIKHYFMFLC
jgi:hypothetical protein